MQICGGAYITDTSYRVMLYHAGEHAEHFGTSRDYMYMDQNAPAPDEYVV